MASGLKELFYVFHNEEDLKQEPKEKTSHIPFTKEGIDLIDKKRALKRWNQSFGYYSLNTEKFKFGLKDL